MLRKLRSEFPFLLTSFAVIVAQSAGAQDFPTKPIRIIAASAPGVAPDVVARLLAADLSTSIGQQVIVENKPGASQVIGFEYVAKQVPADGYTLAVTDVSGLAQLPVITKSLRFDPLKDLPPIIGFAEGRLALAISSQLPWKTFNEMVANVKVDPGRLNYGASAPANRFPALAVLRGLGLDVAYVGFSSGAAYMQAIFSGTVQMGTISEGVAAVGGERVRLLAITGEQRNSTLFRDVPTFAELGMPGIPGLTYSLNAPAGTPEPVTGKIHAAASRALQSADVKARFAKVGWDVIDRRPEVIAKMLLEQSRFFADVAKKAGIQPE